MATSRTRYERPGIAEELRGNGEGEGLKHRRRRINTEEKAKVRAGHALHIWTCFSVIMPHVF